MDIDRRYTSWADQWDTRSEYVYPTETKKGNGIMSSKYGKKVGVGFEKTKVVASSGMKKVKQGTTVGFHWIKDKYHKTTHK